ncbi:hypothetical protein [Brachybacterium sp. p3-SID957]|uniref:hypothetical protein n=1 Tax=Brachybacterium sp. p3-SID957 TaxID=2916049 RepID=UPI00223C1DEE|nr:hypothetical protein [Brachybacterium sp. p3-SID957]MCT1777114.1 hypothetical protein [Brachybacterium sp. p3-SID957]
MTEHSADTGGDDAFREVLRRWESEQGEAPAFGLIRRRIASAPSPMDAPRWPARRSAKLAAVLAWAQMRVVPWLILPVALVTVTMAIFAARFFGVTQGGSAGDTGFASVMLAGIAVTVTMALSSAKPDSIALATPLGPQVVVLARIALVLVVDAATGLAASGLVSAWGYTSGLPDVVASWLIPVALVAGAATFASIWVAPWAGIAAGLVLIPMAVPVSEAMFFFGLSGLLWNALTPLGLLGAGAALLGAAVTTARRAAISGLQSA